MPVKAGHDNIAGDIYAALVQHITEGYCHYIACTYDSVWELSSVLYEFVSKLLSAHLPEVSVEYLMPAAVLIGCTEKA